MEPNQGLPLYSGPVDHLRLGFNSLEVEHAAQHPLQKLQSSQNFAWLNKLEMVRRTYGSHLAMRLATEREVFSRMKRLPGLESSNISYDTVMGLDEKIEFQDFLNDPYMRPESTPLQIHTQMEIKLGFL